MEIKILDELITNYLKADLKKKLTLLKDISYFNSEKAFSIIINALSDENIKIKLLALNLLKKYCNTFSLNISEKVINLLNDQNKEIALSAANLIGETHNPKIIDKLIEFLASNNEELKINAIIACKKITNEKIKELLIKIVKESKDENNKKLQACAISGLASNMSSDLILFIKEYGLDDDDLRVKASAIETLSALKLENNEIIPLIKPYLLDSNARIVANAAIALSKYNDTSIYTYLEKLLKHENKLVRAAGCYALGKINNETAFKTLIKHKNDNESIVRIHVANSLFEFKKENAVSELISMLNDSDNNVKNVVCQNLLNLNLSYAFWPIIKLLHSQVPLHMIISANVLCNIGDEAAIPLLNEVYEKLPKSALKNEIYKYLKILTEVCEEKNELITKKRYGLTTPITNNEITNVENVELPIELMLKPYEEKNFIHLIVEKLFNKSQFLREEAAIELAHINSYKAVLALTYGLSDPVPKIRAICARSLSKYCLNYKELLPKVKEGLLKLLNDSYTEAAKNAAMTLSIIRDKSTIDSLLKLINHQNADTRLYAIMALGKMADSSIGKILADKLKSEENKKVRATLVTALGFLKEPEFFDVILKEGINDKDPHVRASAIEAIVKLNIEPEKKIPIIKNALNDINNRVIANACVALWQLGDLEALVYVNKLLKSDNKWYRASGCYALGQIGNVEATNMLISFKNDPDPDVRLNVAKALGHIKNVKALTTLIEMLDDSDELVKTIAYDTIINYNEKFAFWPMIQYLKSPYEVIRYIAVKILCNIGDPKCMPFIFETLTYERNIEVKEEMLKIIKLFIHNKPLESYKEILNENNKNHKAIIEALQLIEVTEIPLEIKQQIYEIAKNSKLKKVVQYVESKLNN